MASTPKSGSRAYASQSPAASLSRKGSKANLLKEDDVVIHEDEDAAIMDAGADGNASPRKAPLPNGSLSHPVKPAGPRPNSAESIIVAARCRPTDTREILAEAEWTQKLSANLSPRKSDGTSRPCCHA